jgi:uncharacterized caspase-like protein
MSQRDWKPAHTYVLVLGLGLADWADPDDPSWERHRTIAEFFRDAGVPEEQVLFWEDDDGEPETMREKLPEFLANTSEESLFFFYYAGHGGLDEENEDSFYFVHPTSEDAIYGYELFDMIEENFYGSQAVLLADCCYSGALVELAQEREGDVSYGALTSATSQITSTGNWTFSDCLLEGLHGSRKIDEDGDGSVTFQELSEYVMRRMKKDEKQAAEYGESGDFDPSFRLARARKRTARA